MFSLMLEMYLITGSKSRKTLLMLCGRGVSVECWLHTFHYVTMICVKSIYAYYCIYYFPHVHRHKAEGLSPTKYKYEHRVK